MHCHFWTHPQDLFYLPAAQVGRTLTDDPEEEKAQKALKSLLNKITPDNFDRIKNQVWQWREGSRGARRGIVG